MYSPRPLWTQTIFEYLSKDVLSPATVNLNNFWIFKYKCTFTCWVFSLTQINIFWILRVYVAFVFSKIVKCSLPSVFCLLSTSVYCLLFKVNCQCHCTISAYTVYVILSIVHCLPSTYTKICYLISNVFFLFSSVYMSTVYSLMSSVCCLLSTVYRLPSALLSPVSCLWSLRAIKF